MYLRVMIIYILIVLFAVPAIFDDNQCCRKLQKKIQREIDNRCSCPFGFIYFKRVCYWFVMGNPDVSNWWDAQNYCRNHGGNLVTVDQNRRENFIRQHLKANFPNTEIKIYTGLIYTDVNAEYPHDPHNANKHPTSSDGDAVRWSSTKKSVNLPLVKAVGSVSKWSPPVNGTYDGPSHSSYLSCVVIFWNETSVLTWRFNECSEKNLKLICEVRRYKSSTSRAHRNKRSQSSNYMDIFFGVTSLEDKTRLGEHGKEKATNNDFDGR